MTVRCEREADLIVEAATDEMRGRCKTIEREGAKSSDLTFGEGDGLAGILTAIALMRRYGAGADLDTLTDMVLDLLVQSDFSCCEAADRTAGFAGLVSCLCRFDEYQGLADVIGRASDRILELKTLEYEGHLLWKTLSRVPRALTGAGHGMSGIAGALYAAACVCGDDRYAVAADDAMDYELAAYQRYHAKYGTWADLRHFPPKGYLHGYCAGAYGTGIMAIRMIERGMGGWRARELAGRVRASVDELGLDACDHLCCGNATIAEYYLTAGDHAAAGGVLGAMLEHKLRWGTYRDRYSGEGGNVTASLFNGISGIGYEMLRYARPNDTISVL